MTYVRGNCPMGCGADLILGENGVLWCGELLCPEPDAAARILADTETHHIVMLAGDGWTVRHPLRERLDDMLMQCPVAQQIAADELDALPYGRYRVRSSPAPPRKLAWEPLE